jgi:YfiH family protein
MFITHERYQPTNIRYGFFTKNIPNSSHRYLTHYDGQELNIKLVAEIFGSQSIALVKQEHTNKVIITNDYENYQVADGQVTSQPNVALAVVTADCVPILLADQEAGIISSVHAGWRGARADIIEQAVKQMKSLGAKNITAIIGPCIKQHCYEVDSSFYQNFISESNAYQKFFIPSVKQNHYMFDLTEYVKNKLTILDIVHIFDIECNTYDDEENFFSFRRTTHNSQSPMGHLISVIMLLDK